MDEGTTISYEGDHIRALSRAHKSIGWATEFFSDLVEACQTHHCYDVLSISESLSVIPILDGFDFIEIFRDLGIDKKYRIAWVELNPEAVETVKFVETSLYNRALPGRLFRSEDDARKWLLDNRRTTDHHDPGEQQ